MREYRFQATDETVELLRKLRGPWRGFTAAERSFNVVLADGTGINVHVGAADVEDSFEAFRLEALSNPSPEAHGEPAGDFSAGSNDVVLFTGASWSEQAAQPTLETVINGKLPDTSLMNFSGHPGQLSDTADVVCLTTDAIVVAATTGAGLLVRTGLKPYSLDMVRDAETISAFLRERGYQSE